MLPSRPRQDESAQQEGGGAHGPAAPLPQLRRLQRHLRPQAQPQLHPQLQLEQHVAPLPRTRAMVRHTPLLWEKLSFQCSLTILHLAEKNV